MPILRVLSLEGLVLDLLLELVQESILCAHAEITDAEEAHFLEDEFTRELELEGRLAQEVLQSQRRDLHDVADVETVDPLRLIQVPKDVLHV